MKRFHASALWVVDVGCECISSGLRMLQKASRADLWYFAGILGPTTKTSFLGLNRERPARGMAAPIGQAEFQMEASTYGLGAPHNTTKGLINA